LLSTSVVIPTKNNIGTIDECLSSLMPYYKEGYISEIVVVDGHSTDGTLDVVKKYPVKVLSEEGTTHGDAWETGWRHSSSELVMFTGGNVHLGNNFFPEVYELFSDDKVGWVSSYEKAVVSNWLTKVQAEDWLIGIPRLSPSPSWFQRLYGRIASGGSRKPLCGGPCVVVRRTCLEAVNGFQGLRLETLKICGDISVSQRVANKGWKTIWWYDAPVYHHPRATFKGYMKQMYSYGKSIAYMHLESEFIKSYPWYNKVMSIMARLASPVIGVYLAIRFRNPLHLIVYPLIRYTVATGYIVGWIGAKKSA
jgi:glycosyltransferase involved in cell wall biosynthesis